MKNKLICGAVQAAVLGSALAIPQFGHTQGAVSLEEVVVVARKRSENLQDVPIAVTAFSAAQIQSAGIERPQDFIALTPNMSIVDTANAGDTQVTIRGQYSTRDAESSFAYVVDGVLITNPNGFNGEMFDTEQIEVLKGPQGALYGRNAVAGAIIVTTRRPTNDFEAMIKGGVGDDNLKKGRAMVSGPIIEDELFGRLAVNYRKTDGQFTNAFTGDDDSVNYAEETDARLRLIWEPSERLSVDVVTSYRDVKGGAINFNAVFAFDVAAQALGNPDLYGDVNDHNFKYVFNVPGENKQENTFFSAKTDYELDFATLTVTAAFDDLTEYLISDGTSAAFGGYSFGAPASQSACTQTYNSFDTSLLQSPFYAIQDGQPPGTAFVPAYGGLNGLLPPYSPTTCDGYQYQQRDQNSGTLEVRLTSKEEGSLRWLAGLYYADIERKAAVAYGADLGLGFRRNSYVPPEGPNPTDLLFRDKFTTEVYAVFGQLEWDVGEQGELAFALRYDEEDRKVDNTVPNVLNSQIFGQFGQQPINPAYNGSLTDSIPSRDKTFSAWQPKLSYTHEFTDELNAYASYGVGFRSGGFNSIGSEATINGAFGTFATAPQQVRDNYDKETTDTYELGIKSQWLDNRLRVNGATFYSEVDDYQFFNFFAGSFGLLRVVTNIDKVEIYGAEVDFAYALNDFLTLSGGYGVINTEIKQNSNRTYTEGNDVPYAPEASGAFSLDFNMPVFGDMELMSRLDYEYVGETWFHSVQEDVTINAFTDLSGVYGVPGFGFGPSEYSNTKRDDYWKINLRIGLSNEHWSLVAWSQNLTDEDFLEEIIPAPEFGGSFIHDSVGRVSGVDLTYTF